jgi:hypothetical protein
MRMPLLTVRELARLYVAWLLLWIAAEVVSLWTFGSGWQFYALTAAYPAITTALGVVLVPWIGRRAGRSFVDVRSEEWTVRRRKAACTPGVTRTHSFFLTFTVICLEQSGALDTAHWILSVLAGALAAALDMTRWTFGLESSKAPPRKP